LGVHEDSFRGADARLKDGRKALDVLLLRGAARLTLSDLFDERPEFFRAGVLGNFDTVELVLREYGRFRGRRLLSVGPVRLPGDGRIRRTCIACCRLTRGILRELLVAGRRLVM